MLKADGFALLEKVLVWLQAQHTIPSPIVLGNIKGPLEGMDNLTIADMLGWPSDFQAWGRLIDWIISEADAIPVKLIPNVLQVFDVWQNALSDLRNARSKEILERANAWLMRLETGELGDGVVVAERLNLPQETAAATGTPSEGPMGHHLPGATP